MFTLYLAYGLGSLAKQTADRVFSQRPRKLSSFAQGLLALQTLRRNQFGLTIYSSALFEVKLYGRTYDKSTVKRLFLQKTLLPIEY